MALKEAFYRALLDGNELADASTLKFVLTNTAGTDVEQVTVTGTSPQLNPTGGTIDCLGINQSEITYQNITGTFDTFRVETLTNSTAANNDLATFSISVTATDQDVTVSNATVTFTDELGGLYMADFPTVTTAFITPVNDANGTPTYITGDAATLATNTTSALFLQVTNDTTQTATNNQGTTYGTINGLRHEANIGGATREVSDGVIKDTLQGTTETTSWQDGQQLQITKYEIQF